MTSRSLRPPWEIHPGCGVLVRAALVALAALGLSAAGGWMVDGLGVQGWLREGALPGMVIAAAAASYVIVMALPFVPGIEIGLALMLLLGEEGVVLVYLCTQLALALSFACGRLVPPATLAGAFRALGLERAARRVGELDATRPERRLERLMQHAPDGWIVRLARHRHIALALALNLPGNAVIGGAGGIGMIAGMSRVIGFPAYSALMALATLPVPVLLLLTGAG